MLELCFNVNFYSARRYYGLNVNCYSWSRKNWSAEEQTLRIVNRDKFNWLNNCRNNGSRCRTLQTGRALPTTPLVTNTKRQLREQLRRSTIDRRCQISGSRKINEGDLHLRPYHLPNLRDSSNKCIETLPSGETAIYKEKLFQLKPVQNISNDFANRNFEVDLSKTFENKLYCDEKIPKTPFTCLCLCFADHTLYTIHKRDLDEQLMQPGAVCSFQRKLPISCSKALRNFQRSNFVFYINFRVIVKQICGVASLGFSAYLKYFFFFYRNSRIPSADSIPQQVEGERLIRGGSTSTLSNNGGQQMTKQTLQALSAVPRPRIVKGDEWVQRRKSDVPRGTLEYNYQHWLIQVSQKRSRSRRSNSPRESILKKQNYLISGSRTEEDQWEKPTIGCSETSAACHRYFRTVQRRSTVFEIRQQTVARFNHPNSNTKSTEQSAGKTIPAPSAST